MTPCLLRVSTWLIFAALFGGAAIAAETEPGFTRIFNGRDLSGWDSMPASWRVEGGAIRSGGTQKNWLVWRGGEVADFELRLRFRFTKGNSGVQVRSEDKGNWQVHGYQVEVAPRAEMGLWHESLWKEQERRFLATAGQKVHIAPDGTRNVEQIESPAKVQAAFKEYDWNDLTVIGDGLRLVQIVNGVVFSELRDEDRRRSRRSGVIALQDHGGDCVVEFKDIRLRRVRGLAGNQDSQWVLSYNLDGKARVAPEVVDATKPNVLIIGDSISIDYTETVRQRLAGFANVYRVATNAQESGKGVREIDQWLRTGGVGKWHLIHFNFGLHDIKGMPGPKPGTAYADRPCFTPPADYRKNLEHIADGLLRTNATLVWCATTPSPAEQVRPPRRNSDIIAYNRIAADVMQRRGIMLHDLYAKTLPRLSEVQIPANVHFTHAGSAVLGEMVAQYIREALSGQGPCLQPGNRKE